MSHTFFSFDKQFHIRSRLVKSATKIFITKLCINNIFVLHEKKPPFKCQTKLKRKHNKRVTVVKFKYGVSSKVS